MERVLGIDYGDRKIGLAIGDTENKTALPLEVIYIKRENDAIEKIKNIIKSENIDKIIIGLPVSMKNKDTERTGITQKFIDILREKVKIPVQEIDERLTTKAASRLVSGKKPEDHIAAMMILQTYLGL